MGAAPLDAPIGTWLPKYIACAISLFGAIIHIMLLPRGPAPVLSVWMAVFFTGGAASAAIGATLEAAFHDTQEGPAWSAMLVGVEVAAAGAWVSGAIMCATGTRFLRIATRIGAYSGLGIFVLTLILVFTASPKQRFDLAFTLAAYGGVGMLLGASVLAVRVRGLRIPCLLIVLGVAVTAAGYGLDAAWLGPSCAPPRGSRDCPLPAGWTADGVYHSALAIAYLLILIGSARLAARKAPTAAATTSATAAAASAALLSVQHNASRFEQPGHVADPCAACISRYESLLLTVHAVVVWLMTSVPPAKRRPLRIKHAINTHKALCAPVVVAFLIWRRCSTPHAYAYLAMHGLYGLTWLIKDQTFPDKSWEAPASIASFLTLFSLMALFWIAPALLVSSPMPRAEVTGLALCLWIVGFFFLHVSDAQKFFTLRVKSGLIDDGLYARTRNPNYFGELLIYSAFALSACESKLWYVPWAVNLLVWSVLFVPNWIVKDRSISRHPGWERYRKRSGLVIPWCFGDGWWRDDE